MLLSLLLLALVIAIAIKQGTHGLFSAFIMTILTICCAAAALGTYEWVANHWLESVWPKEKFSPDFMLPVTLGVSFSVPLLLLRLTFDRLVRRSSLLPSMLDRVGSGVCGLVTGFVMVGIWAICIQMIPFNGSFLGYSRVAEAMPDAKRDPNTQPPDRDEKERGLLLDPGAFAAKVVSLVSNGVFSGSQRFSEHNFDLSKTVGWVGATHREVSRYAPPRSISIVRTEPVEQVYEMTVPPSRTDEKPNYRAIKPVGGEEFRMVRVQLRREALDKRKKHLFTLRQFRLVGKITGDEPNQFYPIAIQQEDETDVVNRHIRFIKRGGNTWPATSGVYEPRGKDAQVEIVFEIPTGFKPDFLEYKREARARVSFDQTARAVPGRTTDRSAEATSPAPGTPGTPPAVADAGTSRPPETTTTTPPRRQRRRTQTVAVADDAQSRFSNELPMTLRSYQQARPNMEVSRGALAGGHLVAEVDQQGSGPGPEIRRFRVPRDKRLLQLSTQRLQARSTLGRALSQAIATVQNYTVRDANGREYLVVGKYAIANVNGRNIIEIQYFPEQVGTIGGLGAFTRINESNLKTTDRFALLFLVDPGARIVSFSTGGSASHREDLTTQNLTAPQ